MGSQKQILLLVGSLKGSKSTSDYVGGYLLNELHKRSLSTEKIYISNLFVSLHLKQDFLSKFDSADVIIFSSPLYIDCQPYLMIKAMEMITEYRKNNICMKKQRLLVITNGGYPEAHHNDTALAIYRYFAAENKLEWIGGLPLGMGAGLSIPLIRKINFLVGMMKKSLNMTAEAIAENRPISNEVVDLMMQPMVPIWLYSFLARSIARFFSITNKAWNIYEKPAQKINS